MGRRPGATADFSVQPNRIRPFRCRVVVVEVIDQLLGAQGIRRRQNAIVQKPAGIAVGCPICINGEGGSWLVGGGDERIFDNFGVLLACYVIAKTRTAVGAIKATILQVDPIRVICLTAPHQASHHKKQKVLFHTCHNLICRIYL